MDLEDDPSDTHEDDDYEVSYMIPVPKNGTPKDLSLTPISIMVVDTIHRVIAVTQTTKGTV